MSFGAGEGLPASLGDTLNPAVMTGALVIAVACLVCDRRSQSTLDSSCLYNAVPSTRWASLISGLSLLGVPLTVRFISKWYLLQAAFSAGHWYAGFLIVASSLIALIYIGRITEVMLLREPATEGPLAIAKKDAPLSMLIPMWVLVGANIYFGLRTELTGGLAERAATALMTVAGGAP